MIDRTEANRALAKALAFHEAGKPQLARDSALVLVQMLENEDVLPTGLTTPGALHACQAVDDAFINSGNYDAKQRAIALCRAAVGSDR